MKRRHFLSGAAGIPSITQSPDDDRDRAQAPARPHKAEEHNFDLLVVGGGMAGLCAAIAAARNGVKVGLVQDRPVFGGNASSEIRVRPAGAARNLAWARETGIIEELMLEDLATNHARSNSHWDLILFNAVKREPNITTFLNTRVREVNAGGKKRRILSVRACQLATEKEFTFTASHYADCTGDATVGFLAGADFRYGCEPRAEYREPLAPVQGGGISLGATIGILARDTGRPAPYKAPDWVKPYRKPEDFGPGRGPSRGGYGKEFEGWWWLSVGHPYHQVHDTEAVRDELLRHVLGAWDYIKNHAPNRAEAANHVLEWVGMVPGKRESRRLMGDVVLTEQDCHQDRQWPDRVCYAGWDIDLHVRGNILNTADPPERALVDRNYRYWITVAPFTLPLRCFYSRNIENLWMAGRDISVSHVALGPVRVQSTTASHGQAVGSAAAYAIRHNLTPREAADPKGRHIARIQQGLLRDDLRIPGLRNEDPDDLALRAKARADSEAVLSFGGALPDAADWLERPLAQVFPVTHGRVDSVELYLKNREASAVEAAVELEEISRIWDRMPGKSAGSATISIPGRWQGWVKVELGARVTPNRPYRCSVRGPGSVGWAKAARFPTGTAAQFLHVSPGGCEPKNRKLPSFAPEELDLPAYRHWITAKSAARAIRVWPAPQPYGGANVNNGVAWPIDMPNLWISDPAAGLPQAVELDFGGIKDFDTAMIAFDTDLDPQANLNPPFWKAATCARDWRLYARVDGSWQLVHEEQNNYQRRRAVRFARVPASGVKLEILASQATGTGAEDSARVYEIRVYDSRRPG